MEKRKCIIAVASGGGHWLQMMELYPAFSDQDVFFITTKESFLVKHKLDGLVIPDCNAREPLNLARAIIAAFKLVRRLRPRVVVSTGAAPGVIVLFLASLFGAKTIWIDSVANAERLSLSGRLAGFFVNVWLTQWPHLAVAKGPEYHGSVL
jgi:UDP-N-acetylglucosamine:LPS N-acetylglucosamine transferase